MPIVGIFHEVNHPVWGTLMTMETPMDSRKSLMKLQSSFYWVQKIEFVVTWCIFLLHVSISIRRGTLKQDLNQNTGCILALLTVNRKCFTVSPHFRVSQTWVRHFSIPFLTLTMVINPLFIDIIDKDLPSNQTWQHPLEIWRFLAGKDHLYLYYPLLYLFMIFRL